MAGDAQCQWAAWFRAHHTYQRRPGDFDLATWTARHNTMVEERAAALRAEGYHVLVEGQNAFKLRGRDGTVLAGKPDLVATRGEEATVIDCKTGSPKTADQFQVLVYMLSLPHCHDACRGRQVEGEVQYRNDVVRVPASKVTHDLRTLFRDTMHRVGRAAPLPRVPSAGECRFCDIGAGDCPDRIEAEPEPASTDHDLF